jgi:flagellar hook-associated protein 1 FlgK
MSTFGALHTAYSGLSAARAALDTAGQNIANANTAGYTRQRVNISSVAAPANVGLAAAAAGPGQGVNLDGIARLGDAYADNRVRSTAAESGYASTRAEALSAVEANLREPGNDGISAQLHTFWDDWSGAANQPNTDAAAHVLLQDTGILVDKISAGYTAMNDQWTSTRGTVDTMAADLNATASQVAVLNGQIRSTLAAGGSANELMDQRSKLAVNIATLTGGTVREQPDGTVDVVIGGNAVVSGTTARSVAISGAARMDSAAAAPVRLEWADRPGQSVSLDGGKLAGALSVLAPDNGGTGGAIAEAAEGFNRLAQSLAATVNPVHQGGATPAGATNLEFFHIAAGVPAALGLSVVPQGKDDLATGTAGAGAFDGSNADSIARLGTAAGGPDATWSLEVTNIGVAARSATLHGNLAEAASTAAKQAQASASGVDLDEENVNILAQQRAYQAAARVMSAIDETLDTLINRTGIVGR